MTTWLEKYRPVTLDDYIGQRSRIRVMESFIDGWITGERREGFLLLTGPAGVGKTTFAHAVVNDLGITIMEVNASDSRRKADLENVVGISQLQSYDNDGRLLLLDEADGIQRWDPLKALLTTPPLPIVITANDASKIPYDIRQMATEFILSHPPEHQRRNLVDRICDGEDLKHSDSVKDAIARQCGSWRSVINTLLTTPVGENPVIIEENETGKVGNEVRRILHGEKIHKPKVSTGQIMRWGNWNMADPDTIQTSLHFQEVKKFAGGVGKIVDTLIHTLRVKGQIDAPEWRARPKKEKVKMPEKVKTVAVTPKKQDNGFGGFFS